MKIKLCGVRTVEDALLCADAGADEIGVVFAASSKRRVTVEMACAIRAALPASVPLVGVFLDAELEDVRVAAREARLAAVQLHGRAADGVVEVPRIRAVHVSGPEDLRSLSSLVGYRRVLLDGPKGGGSGTSFAWPWALQAAEHFDGDVFVAGGLTPENVAQAVREARPHGVDVASGIEGANGFKDPARVRAFVQAARAAAGE